MREALRMSEVFHPDPTSQVDAEVSEEAILAAATKLLPFRVLITDSEVLVGSEIDAANTPIRDKEWS